MFEKAFRGRLDVGFNPLGFDFAGFGDRYKTFEYRNPNKPLRFAVRYGEGATALLWTNDQETDLLNGTAFPPDVSRKVFSGSPEEFWQAVKDVTEGKEPA